MPVTEVGCMGVKPDHDVMNDATREGQVLTGVWKTVTTAPGGPQRVYWGLEVEDPSKVWAFFDFESIEEHRKFAETFGGEAVKVLPTILTHGEFSKHVAMTPVPIQALRSPVTGVVLAYFPSDISPAGKDAAVVQLRQFVEKSLDKSPDAKDVTFGWGVENDFPVRGGAEGQTGSVLMMLIGWPSIEASTEFQKSELFQENVGLVKSMEGIVQLVTLNLRCRTLERKTE